VAAVREALHQHWGFAYSDIVTLVNAQAHREAFLAALRELDDWAGPGRVAVVYFSGHGTSPQNPHNFIPMAADTGALVVAPEDLSHPVPSYVVARSDIRPLLAHMDAKGAEVFVAFDACFSQNTARAVRLRDRRYVEAPAGAGGGSKGLIIAGQGAPAAPEGSPYGHIYYISAAGAAEPAADLDSSTYDGQPHGAFTDALLQVMTGGFAHRESQPGRMTYDDLADAVEDFMRIHPHGHTPVRMPGRFVLQRGVATRAFLSWPAPASQLAAHDDDRLRIRADGAPEPVRASLALVPGVTLVHSERDTEYEVRRLGSVDSAANLVVLTAQGEPLYGTGGLRGAIIQDQGEVLESVKLRAGLRQLWAAIRARESGLALEAGLSDDRIGQTVSARDAVALQALTSEDAQIVLLHVMGDGSTRVWLPSADEGGSCSGGNHLAAGQRRVLCRWNGARPPYGLDSLYVVAFSGVLPPELTRLPRSFDEDLITSLGHLAASRRTAMAEVTLYTVGDQ
jgi:hypothetical protein